MRARWALALAGSTMLSGCTESAPTALELNGPPASLAILSGDGQTGVGGGTLAQPLVVLVTDEAGRAVPAVRVTWSSSAGAVTPAIDSTDNDGHASAAWQLPDDPGQVQVTASVSGLGSVIFNATATLPGTAAIRPWPAASSGNADPPARGSLDLRRSSPRRSGRFR